MKRLVFLGFVALLGVLVALPAMAAPRALNEAELDAVTAAGQPTVLIAGTVGTNQSSGAGSVGLFGTSSGTLTIGTGGQNDLRALVLNNISGENQVATAVNVTSVNASSNQEQRNTINQSWGATLDLAVRAGASSSAVFTGVKCILATCASASAAASTRMSAYADDIVLATTIVFDPYKQFDLTVAGQASLAALAVNNVIGLNNAATALNIMGGGVTVAGGAGSTLGLLPIGVGGVTRSDQTNTIAQYRGTPATRP